MAPGLSDHARKALYAESEKYSKALLGHLQAKLGRASGARKYAEVLALIEFMFANIRVVIVLMKALTSLLRGAPHFAGPKRRMALFSMDIMMRTISRVAGMKTSQETPSPSSKIS